MIKINKQAQAKFNQGYRKAPNSCSNCINYRVDIIKEEQVNQWGYNVFILKEKNRRCDIGGFSVKKTHVCNSHKLINQLEN